MPKIKRQVTETSEVEAPQKEAPPTLVDFDLWDYLEKLKDNEFVEGSLVKRKFYVSQIEPSVTKAEGEPGYARIFSSRFGPDDIKALNPQAIRWRIIEKVMGKPGTRNMWYIAMMPEKLPPPGSTASTIAAGSEMGQALRTVVELASDRTGVQREAITQSMGVLSEAYRKGIDMIPRNDSFADQLTKMKDAGLLNTGGGGIDFGKFEGFLEKTLTVLDRLGILRKNEARENPKLGELTELMDFAEERFGRMGGRHGGDSIWPGVIQMVGPAIARSIESAFANFAYGMSVRAQMLGIKPQDMPAVKPIIEPASPGASNGVTSVPGQATAVTQVLTAEDFIKARFVELCREELQEEEPDAEQLANWLDMTAPQFAALLKDAPEKAVLAQLNQDVILAKIGDDAKAIGLKKAILKVLKEEPVKV